MCDTECDLCWGAECVRFYKMRWRWEIIEDSSFPPFPALPFHLNGADHTSQATMRWVHALFFLYYNSVVT